MKQYKKIFSLDDVELMFEEEAILAIAEKAIEKKTGARGLRSIIESIITDIMFEIPSNENIEKCVITREVILDKKTPEIIEGVA